MSEYALDLLDRATKTAAQTALVTLGAEALNVFAVDWYEVGGIALGGAFLSLLTNIGQRGLFGTGAPE